MIKYNVGIIIVPVSIISLISAVITFSYLLLLFKIAIDPSGIWYALPGSTLLNFKLYDIEITKEKNDQQNKDGKPRLVEYNEYNFFELLKKSNNAGKNKGKLLAEAHSRNTIILMPLVFSLIVMVTLLKDNFSRIFSIYRKTTGIGLLVIVQSLVLIIKNAVHFNTMFLPLMYIFPICILIISIIFLSNSSKLDRPFLFTKKIN